MTTKENAAQLRGRLRTLGLSGPAIDAAWPQWWSEEADASLSARTELRFSVARRLGLDPRSLMDDTEQPRFLWRDEARFKHLSGEGDVERAGITSFGRSVASALTQAYAAPEVSLVGGTALQLRDQILGSGRPYVDLTDLLALAWSTGVPVIHLRVFPWPQKRMAAMTARVGDRWAILLAKDSNYPAPTAFYLAHELGHVALGQVAADRLIVDLADRDQEVLAGDAEENQADEFALELLTGRPRPNVLASGAGKPSARAVAHAALGSAGELAIEPGTLAQCYGFSTKNWRAATGSFKYIYTTSKPVWMEVNGIARRELANRQVAGDTAEFIDAVLGPQADQ